MSKFKNLKVGEVLSETQYFKVEKMQGDRVQMITDSGDRVVVDSGYVDKHLASANQYEKTEKVTKTRLAEIFYENSRIAMTVNYNKQVDQNSVLDEITNIYDQLKFNMTKDDFKKEAKKALNLKGEERTMIGRHYGSHDVNGRVHFIDMEISRDTTKDYDTRQRLVDPRTLNFIIVNNVKYQSK